MPSEKTVVILGGVRTPFAKAGAALEGTSAVELGCRAAAEAMHRLELPFDAVDEVIFGNVAQPADAPNISRVIALRAGFPMGIPAYTVHRNCASGMEAVTSACEKIRQGQAGLILAGGVESMSQIPFLYPRDFQRKLFRVLGAKKRFEKLGAWLRFRPRDLKPIFGLEAGLRDPVCGANMGQTAENLAREFGIGREEQDQFALESHQKTVAAQSAGLFKEEIAPVYAPPDFKEVAEDVGPRANQSLEALAKLRPYFDRDFGTVTVGNACPVTDGAGALLVASEERAAELGIEPLGRIVAYAYAGCPPDRMGLGPVFATARALRQSGLGIENLDRLEINEAFAAQVLACERAFESEEFARRELGQEKAVGALDRRKLNVNGGAIALGHPVGATGARLILTLLLELRRRRLQRGLATLCIGGGQGGAVILERMAG
ncbi:MAG: thiolase family protein [Planctomycetes bacterium]|nr:thiolase family protein [Planctomycetota bacterium]